MRTHIAVVLACLVGSAAFAGVAKKMKVEPKPAPAPVAPVVIDEESSEYGDEELVEMKKKRIPMPPTQERVAYLAWKKKLPAAPRARLDRYCRSHGGEYRAACNGIGPLGIPTPPSLVKMKRSDGDGEIGMTHEQWQQSLTPAQNRYYEDYCGPKHGGPEENGYSTLCGGTPLVLSFDNERVQYTPSSTGPSDWPTTTTPWLALDRDGDGAITDAAELFGSSTLLEGGRAAKHGFEALAALDANRDGVIDAQDPVFEKLVVWTDRDGDRQSSTGELSPLSAAVVSLSLGYHREAQCDERMNCEGERAPMQWRDETGARKTGTVVDVYLHYR